MSERTADDVIRSNECNTYVMSCHLSRDELYKSMRDDISIMCDSYTTLKAQRDELLAAAKAYQELSVCYRLNKRPTEKLFDRLETANFAIANVEATSCD